MFKPERALTDQEIVHLNHMAATVLGSSRGILLLESLEIPVWVGRHPLCVQENLVREFRKMAEICPLRDDLVEFVEAWPNYVKEYLGTESWEYGYGFVGVAS